MNLGGHIQSVTVRARMDLSSSGWETKSDLSRMIQLVIVCIFLTSLPPENLTKDLVPEVNDSLFQMLQRKGTICQRTNGKDKK